MFDVLEMGASGLQAQRTRMDVIAGNILNVSTTRNAAGEKTPYRRRYAVIASGQAQDKSKPGVHVSEVKQDQGAFQVRHQPGHPDADPKTGNVLYPNIDLAVEYVDALEASRAYEANVTMMETTKAMFNSSLRLLA